MGESFLNGRVMLHAGNCLDVLARLEDCSVDSCVTDPPYHLTSIVKRFGSDNAAPAQFGTDGRYARASAGFMGKQWDGGDIAFDPTTWAAVFRVLKPGGHLLAMGGTRTFHRLACAIEDAGFEIRDTIMWVYGSGFPKSHDVSKGIDRAAGAERERTKLVGTDKMNLWKVQNGGQATHWQTTAREQGQKQVAVWNDKPLTDAARQWEGWGTALKPACELIVLARKPLSEGTVAANVLRWGTGAINISACRVRTADGRPLVVSNRRSGNVVYGDGLQGSKQIGTTTLGRWPANVAHDGSDEVTAAFPDSGPASDKPRNNGDFKSEAKGYEYAHTTFGHADNGGSAARFFYTAKADADDRLGSKHPTVKPLDLMQWLVRLVTPKGGTCLDPFAGTGTTGEAAWREGCNAVLIEAETEYQADIRRRMALVLAGPDERVRESIKAKGLPVDYGPLFALPEAAE